MKYTVWQKIPDPKKLLSVERLLEIQARQDAVMTPDHDVKAAEEFLVHAWQDIQDLLNHAWETVEPAPRPQTLWGRIKQFAYELQKKRERRESEQLFRTISNYEDWWK